MQYRQEAVKVVLAEVMHKRGLVTAPEQIIHLASSEVRLPDILVDYQGLRLGIECEIETTLRACSKKKKPG